MKTIIRVITIIIFTSFIFSQGVEVKDSADHLLISINDEGDTGGSITFPNATSVDPVTNKLYNIDNNLYWNGTILESGGSPVWSLTGNKIYYNLDNVGIGVADPGHKLTILQNHADQQGLVVTQDGDGGAATFDIPGTSSTGHTLNVYNAGLGYGMDLVIQGTGTGPGARFTIDNIENTQPAVFVEHNGPGPGIHIAPNGTGLSLDAAGTIKIQGFEMPVGQIDGHVLTTDGSGVGTWQAPQGGGGADSDWNIVATDMHSNVSGNVGIGEPNPTVKLHVVQMEDAGAGTFILGNTESAEVALTAETNGNGNGAAFMAVAKGADGNAGYFLIEDSNNPQVGLYSHTNGTGAAIRGRTNGLGSAGWFSAMNPSSTEHALRVYTIGGGSAGKFRVNNGANSSTGLFSETNGTGAAIEGMNNGGGRAGWFHQENPGNGEPAVRAETNGDGAAVDGYTNGNGVAISGVTNGGGHAGMFIIDNPGSGNAAVRAETNGGYAAIEGIYNGTGGSAGRFRSLNVANNEQAIYAETNGSGNAIEGYSSGVGRAGSFQINNGANGSAGLFSETNGSGPAIEGVNNGNGRAAWFHQDNSPNPHPALVAETNSTSGPASEFYSNNSANNMPTILSQTSGTGNAGSFTIDNGSNSSAALYATTNGSGYAVEANGPVKMSEFHMPFGQVDGHILTTDGAGMGTWQTPPSADNLGNHNATQDINMGGFEINLNGGWLSGDGDDEGIYIDASGAIGAGTSTLLSGFDVVNNYAPTMRLSHPSGGIGRLMITTDADVGSSNYVDLIFGSDYDSSPNYAGIGQHTDGSLRLTGGSDISSPDMVITDAGRVGMGTTTPLEALHVAGKVRSDTGFNSNNNDGIDGTFNFYNDGTAGNVTQIVVSGGIITAVITAP